MFRTTMLLLLAANGAQAAVPLRLFHTADPCARRPCADWRATDEGDHRSFPAAVAFGAIRLAPSIRGPALRGQVDIMADGDVRPGRDFATVLVRRLNGVEPHNQVVASLVLAAATSTPGPTAPVDTPGVHRRNQTRPQQRHPVPAQPPATGSPSTVPPDVIAK